MKKPKVITMCGSRKFKEEHLREMKRLTLEGNIVFGCISDIGFTEDEWNKISYLQFRRIDISDAIFVVNKEKYIGKFTMDEIQYAKQNGKQIIYLESE